MNMKGIITKNLVIAILVILGLAMIIMGLLLNNQKSNIDNNEYVLGNKKLKLYENSDDKILPQILNSYYQITVDGCKNNNADFCQKFLINYHNIKLEEYYQFYNRSIPKYFGMYDGKTLEVLDIQDNGVFTILYAKYIMKNSKMLSLIINNKTGKYFVKEEKVGLFGGNDKVHNTYFYIKISDVRDCYKLYTNDFVYLGDVFNSDFLIFNDDESFYAILNGDIIEYNQDNTIKRRLINDVAINYIVYNNKCYVLLLNKETGLMLFDITRNVKTIMNVSSNDLVINNLQMKIDNNTLTIFNYTNNNVVYSGQLD